MKHFLVMAFTFVLISNNCIAQWTEWSDLRHGLEVSFKLGKTENDYSYIRFKNFSSAEFCDGRVEFDVFRSGKTDRIGFNCGRIAPQQMLDKGGWWFNCKGSISNLKLVSISDANCKDLLHPKVENTGVTEIVFEKKQPTKEELEQKEREEGRERKRKLQEKLEAEREKERKRWEEQQTKNNERITNVAPGYKTPEQQRQDELIKKADAQNTKRVELQNGLNQAIQATGTMIQNLMAAKQYNDELREKKLKKEILREADEISDAKEKAAKYDFFDKQSFEKDMREYSTKSSLDKTLLYLGYASYIVDRNKLQSYEESIYPIIDIFFDAPENSNITAFEFSQFINILTWKDGALINVLSSDRFLQYLTAKRNKTFAIANQNALRKLIGDMELIAKNKFYAVFQQIAQSYIQSNENIFSDIKFQAVPIPISFRQSDNTVELKASSTLLNLKYSATKKRNKENSLKPSSGYISATLNKVNSFSATTLNKLFSLCPTCGIEEKILKVQSTRIDPDDDKNIKKHDETSCLIKFNADITFSSSFKITEAKNVNIYLCVYNNRLYKLNEKGYSNYYIGFIDDLNSKGESEELEGIKKVISYRNDFFRYVVVNDLRRFLEDGLGRCGFFDSMPGLSMLLISDVDNDPYFIVSKILAYDPF